MPSTHMGLQHQQGEDLAIEPQHQAFSLVLPILEISQPLPVLFPS